MAFGVDTKENIKIDVIKIVNDIFKQAISLGASDVHIESTYEGMVIRYRVDGTLKVMSEGDKMLRDFIISRIKVMATLKTTGLAQPQEGNIKFKQDDIDVDMRISIFPTSTGECVVIRILETDKYFGDFRELGLLDEQVTAIEEIIQRPYGLVLVTGPNGSGKSTTLFTILNRLNKPGKSLVTLEDPVERKIDMVRQTNINPDINLSFASGLRYLLRQDPDIIMVGEIRDKETAQIAVQAAITGHLVLATIHTNNAAGAIVRMINMKVEPFLLSSALKFVTAQRLARVNCSHCKKEYEPPLELLKRIDAPRSIKFYHSIGCETCNHEGIKGRIGVHELIVVTKGIQNLTLLKPSDEQINKIAVDEGMITLRQAALQKVYDGTISIEEAIRLTE